MPATFEQATTVAFSISRIAEDVERARNTFLAEAAAFITEWFVNTVTERVAALPDIESIDANELCHETLALSRNARTLIELSFRSVHWSHQTVAERAAIAIDSLTAMPLHIERRLRIVMAEVEPILRKYGLSNSETEWHLAFPNSTIHCYAHYIQWSRRLLDSWTKYCESARDYLDLRAVTQLEEN